MDADSKIKLAKDAITFVATSHDDGETAVKAHLGELQKHIDECLKALPAKRAAHLAAAKERQARRDAETEKRAADNAAADAQRKREALVNELAALDAEAAKSAAPAA